MRRVLLCYNVKRIQWAVIIRAISMMSLNTTNTAVQLRYAISRMLRLRAALHCCTQFRLLINVIVK